MRRIVRPKAPALEAEIAVGRLRWGCGARELRHRRGPLLIANVNYPDGEEHLVAVGIGGLPVGEHKSLVQGAAPDGVEGDAARAILRRRLETPDFLLMLRVGKVQDDEPEGTPRAVA